MLDSFFYLSAAIIIGLLAGLMSGFLGIGGATITTPLMRMFLGVPGQIAIGTSLLLVIPTALSGAYVFFGKGLLKFKTIAVCGISGIAFTLIGSYLTNFFSGTTLMLMTSVVLVVFALMIFLDKRKKSYVGIGQTVFQKATCSIFIGAVAGFFSGLLGLGGGFMLVPMLAYFRKISLHQSIACSLAIISIYAIPGAIVHFSLGHVDLSLAAMMLAGQVAGVYIGARNVIKVKESDLKPIIIGFFALLGILLAAFELL